jgi:hypothetical protein
VICDSGAICDSGSLGSGCDAVGRRLLLPKAIEAFEMADNGAALARHWPDTDMALARHG